MIRRLLGAFQFLTILPISGQQAEPGKAAIFFPLVGAVLGAAGAGLYLLLTRAFPPGVAALFVLALWALLGGGLHEDGLADVADALRAGRTREKALTVLKDSRIGSYGGLALAFSVLARWIALEQLNWLEPGRLLAALVASQTVSRASLVVLAWLSRPVGTGLGYQFSSSLTTVVAVGAAVQGVLAAFWCGPRVGVTIIVGAYLILRLLRAWFYRRIGGVNGDCLGATSQLVEIFVLLLFTCRNCIW